MRYGSVHSMTRAAAARRLNMFVDLLRGFASATNENIVTDLMTDGDIPVTNAYIHRIKINASATTHFPCFQLFKGLNNVVSKR
jgi:hypothetical protein